MCTIFSACRNTVYDTSNTGDCSNWFWMYVWDLFGVSGLQEYSEEIFVESKWLHVEDVMAYNEKLWNEAKKKCRLGTEEIRMAKEMGLNPKSLIKNIPNPKEQWKAPVKVWIHEMYEDRQEKARKKAKRKAQKVSGSIDGSIV